MPIANGDDSNTSYEVKMLYVPKGKTKAESEVFSFDDIDSAELFYGDKQGTDGVLAIVLRKVSRMPLKMEIR